MYENEGPLGETCNDILRAANKLGGGKPNVQISQVDVEKQSGVDAETFRKALHTIAHYGHAHVVMSRTDIFLTHAGVAYAATLPEKAKVAAPPKLA